MKDGFNCWATCPPPYGVPLVIYCGVKHIVYQKPYTREEIEAWDQHDPEDSVDWHKVGWIFTGIAKNILGIAQ